MDTRFLTRSEENAKFQATMQAFVFGKSPPKTFYLNTFNKNRLTPTDRSVCMLFIMRDKLLDYAEKTAQGKGLEAISFQQLADAVGLSKANVFHHFKNKEE